MKNKKKTKTFSVGFRNFIWEFFSVFSIVAFNFTFMFFLLLRLMRSFDDNYFIALLGLGNLLFTSIISTCMIYFVRSRVYSRKIDDFCKAADRVAQGDYNVRIDVPFKRPRNEMDYLALNFNKMLTEISSLDNMRNDFVADVSHEIKTPLSVVQGYADLLQNKDLSAEKRNEYINKMSLAVNSISTLVSNILKLNKIENQGIVQREEFSLDEQLRECILFFEEKIEEKNLTVDVELDETTVFSDKSLLEVVWNNLISNAVKYNKYSGSVSVKLKNDGKKITVKISDTGCGMTEEIKSHCFEKFYQGDSSHSQEGNGLGLAIVKQVVTLLDGEIKVESDVNQGTHFTVII